MSYKLRPEPATRENSQVVINTPDQCGQSTGKPNPFKKPRTNIADLNGGKPFTVEDLPDTGSPEPLSKTDIEAQLRKRMQEVGIQPPKASEAIIMDGKIQRYDLPDHHPKNYNGWYVLYTNGPAPAGTFGDWSNGEGAYSFRADIGRSWTPEEQRQADESYKQAKEQAEQQRKQIQEQAAKEAKQTWESCKQAEKDHPYLVKKRVEGYGLKVDSNNSLVLPLYNEAGEITSLQFIDTEGIKRFLSGGAIAGSYWWIGDLDNARMAYMAEGYA
ncbi:MAG: hypothetical protein EOM68_25490, partial [Spirochaetia bacterium]|nr:hypothetical protein [Spirochaetia bacterium]